MLKNYDELDKNVKNTTHQASLIEIGMKTKLPSKLIYFIVREENLIVSKKANRLLKDQGESQSLKNRILTSFIYTEIKIPDDNYYKWKITRMFYFIVTIPFFGTFILFCILFNTIFLSLERYPMPQSEKDAYNSANYFFSAIFAIEVVLKIIGQSPKKFIQDYFNIFDSVIVLVSILEVFVSSGSGGGVSALRAFRLFRIFKLFRTGNLRVLLDSIAYTMGTIGNYVILLGLFIYVYSLLGMQFFAGKLTFDANGYYDPNGEVARANFDTIYWAAITVFEVLIGDNWNEVMFDCIKASGKISSAYFISLILFGTIIMLNLFLAILLGNFDKARTFWLKKSIFEMFETAIERYSLNKAISIILGEVNKSVKEELLVHHEKDIFKLNGRLMIINRKMMENDPEEADKLIYYDRVAVYETDYKPILEAYSDEDKEESEDRQESDNFHRSKKSGNNDEDDLERIDEEEEHKDNLNESKEELVPEKKVSQTVIVKYPNEEFTMKVHSPIEENALEESFQMAGSGNIPIKEEDELKYVSLETPREKIDDLEENSREESKLLSKKKIKKSVTFDLRDPQVHEESPEHSFSSKDDGVPEEFNEKIDKERYKAEDNILVSKNEMPFWKKILNHMRMSSLFIFHKDWKIRKVCIDLVVSPENVLEYDNKKKEDAMFNSNKDRKGDFYKTFELQNTFKNQNSFNKQQSIRNQIDQDSRSFKKSRSGFYTNDEIYQNNNLAKTDAKEIAEESKKKKCCRFNSHPSKYFDYVIIVLILISSLLLIADNPLNDPQSKWSSILGIIDMLFSLLFFCEAVIKIIGLGFIHTSIKGKPYITNGWNILDFIVVSASILDLFVYIQDTDSVDTEQLKSLKALRALRALRPLRMISRNEGMRLVVNALFASIPSMTNVLVVCLLFILIFASTGISLFAGKFYHCTFKTYSSTIEV